MKSNIILANYLVKLIGSNYYEIECITTIDGFGKMNKMRRVPSAIIKNRKWHNLKGHNSRHVQWNDVYHYQPC